MIVPVLQLSQLAWPIVRASATNYCKLTPRFFILSIVSFHAFLHAQQRYSCNLISDVVARKLQCAFHFLFSRLLLLDTTAYFETWNGRFKVSNSDFLRFLWQRRWPMDKMFLNVMTVFWISNGHIAIFSNAALTSETVFSQYFYANILNIKWLIADFHQSFDPVIQNI